MQILASKGIYGVFKSKKMDVYQALIRVVLGFFVSNQF
jgi:hypothetical protein